jgi:DNA-binding phage protein
MSEESDMVVTLETLEEEMGGVREGEISPIPYIDAGLLKEIEKNKGLIRMAAASSSILASNDLWQDIESGKTAGEKAAGYGNTLGGVVSGSASGIEYFDGTSEETENRIIETGDENAVAEQASGQIVAAVGSSISLIFSTIKGIAKMYEAAETKEGIKALEGSREFIYAIKSGFDLANNIIKYTSGFANPMVLSVIPGLSIAISACDIIINAYNSFKAKSSVEEMSGVSEKYKAQLVSIFGDLPEKALPAFFGKEKRGKMGSRITYLRIKPGKMEELNKIANSPIEQAEANSRFNLPSNVSFQEFYMAIKSYELGSKMEEINQKRKVFGNRKIANSIIKISSEIASFFPADGGITALALKGVAAGTDGAFSASKFIQSKVRDKGWLGGNKNRSSKNKEKEYINHTKTIYMLLKAEEVDDSLINNIYSEKIDRLKGVESIIKATGVSTEVLYKTNYSNKKEVKGQISLLVKSMKSGRG